MFYSKKPNKRHKLYSIFRLQICFTLPCAFKQVSKLLKSDLIEKARTSDRYIGSKINTEISVCNSDDQKKCPFVD